MPRTTTKAMNFFEAMKAADEGKVVVNCAGDRYKKSDGGKLLWYRLGRKEGREVSISSYEIAGPWTIEEPELKLPEKTVDSLKGKNPVFFVVPLIRKFNALIDLAADLQKQIKELKGERK